MTLTTNGKNYIAQKFGLSNCFVSTGLSWIATSAIDGTQINESGGTASIIGRLVTTPVYANVIINSVTYTYAQLKTANDNTDLTLADAQWVAANDGTPTGEAQYCYSCTPNWVCETPLNGYEKDGCGNRRLNSACNACVPNWQCELPLNGYEADGCGNRRLNSACNPCTPNWQCETPLNGYEFDGCGNRRLNTICNPITTGSISFISNPPGASITLENTPLNQITPYIKQNVPSGDRSYLLKLSGYKDYVGTVYVTANQQANVSVSLTIDISIDKITLSDTFNNYTCYGFTLPKDSFDCNASTFKLYAIYSNGYCDVPPPVNQFIWYKWDNIELRFIEHMRTPIFTTGIGYCTTEINLPCSAMYKVVYGTTEKILTIQQQTIQEFGMGMAAVALVGLFILSKMVSKK